jgi:cell division transport system permease protein
MKTMSSASHDQKLVKKLSRSFRQHMQIAGESAAHLWHTPWSSLMTWLAIGIALALPAGMLLLLGNLQAVNHSWKSPAQISLFLKKDQSVEKIQLLRDQLAKKGGVASVELITADQALAEFRQSSGFGDVLEKLQTNPLPDVLVVHLVSSLANAADKDNQSITKNLFDELRALPAVDQAVLDQAWLQRLQALLQLGNRAASVLAVLLAIGVVVVIGNTIRLAIENRRDEISVVKLVGGTDAFVRRPFLYTGIWFGLGGALFGYILVILTIWWLRAPVDDFAVLYQSAFTLQYPGFADTILLFLSGAALGFLGAWLAVWRELYRIEPN